MLQKVVLETASPLTLNVDAVTPDEILIVKSISGLTSPGNTLFTGDFAGEGGYYQGRRANKLNPVITMKMNPDYANDISVSSIREMLYSTFYEPLPDSDGVYVRLVDDELPDRYLVGYCEDINTDQWSQEQVAAASLVCTDPFMKSVTPVNVTDAAGLVSTTINYEGTARTGLEMTLKVSTACTVITVDINGVTMVLNGTFAVNDVIVINTVTRSRKITQNGTDKMAALTAASKWLALRKGANLVKIYSTVVADGKVKMTNYNYRASWWGV